MARTQNRLTARTVAAATKPGRYGDGGGLSLVVDQDGRRRRWVFRYSLAGKQRDLGLGSAADVTLAKAREAAAAARALVKEGRDPIEAKHAPAPAEAPRLPTFRECAMAFIEENRPTWKNAKHAAQWLSTLEAHVFPNLGDKPVDAITAPEVRDVLVQIWLVIPETARRVRQRVGAVLDWAHAKGYRPAEAPMRAISKGLPRQPKGQEHFAAMPWQDVPAFLASLRGTDRTGPVVKLALELLILTGVRSGEVRGARWSEFDLERREWRIPAERMKAGKAHVVPLSDRALEILAEAAKFRPAGAPADALVFPGSRRAGAMLSDMTLSMLLRRLETDVTAHGFRSSFRDWCAEATNFPREVAEAALAHGNPDRVEAAYRRSDLLERRRKLMAAWAGFCTGSGAGKVVSINGRGRGAA